MKLALSYSVGGWSLNNIHTVHHSHGVHLVFEFRLEIFFVTYLCCNSKQATGAKKKNRYLVRVCVLEVSANCQLLNDWS